MSSLLNLYTALQAATSSLNLFNARFPRPGGNITAINNLSSSGFTPIIGPNPNRNTITFVNPGDATVLVAPTTQGSSAVPLNPTAEYLGGCFPVVPADWVTLTGTVQQGWQAMATAGSSQPFTVMDQ